MHKQLLPLSKFLGSAFSLSGASTEYALDEDAAQFMKEVLSSVEWEAPLVSCGPYSIRPHKGWETHQDVGLFHGENLVGFYEGPNLWIHPDHRGQGLATPLILAAAWLRGGHVLPEGIAEQGYSPAGLLSHVAAHLQSVIADAKAGHSIPEDVLREYGLKTQAELLALFPDEPPLCHKINP